MPAVPAPSGRSAAFTVGSPPSIASALESMPPSAISEITTHGTSTSSTPKISGGVYAAPSRPGATTKGQKNATRPRNAAMANTTPARGAMRMAPAERSVRSFRSFVSYGSGDRIFATCGAKAGEAMSAARAANSTSWVEIATDRPSVASSSSMAISRVLAR